MAEAASSILIQLTALLFLAGSSLVFGRALLARVHYQTSGERTVFALGMGLGVIGWSLFLLGLAGLLYPPLILGLLLVAHALCWREWRAVWSERGTVRTPLLLFAAVFALPSFILSLYPPTGFDETMYHLPYARLFVREHAVVFAESLRFPVFPQLAHLVFTPILMFAGAEPTHVVQFFSAAVTTLAIACWARALEGPRAALWSAAVWIGSPIVVWFAATSYIDLTLALFALLAFRAVAIWSEGGDRGHIVLAGVMAGFAAGTKYHGLVIVMLCAAATLFSSRRSVRSAALFAAGAAVAPAPFYLRNVVVTGNPVFPFLSSLFGQSAWSSPRAASAAAARLHNLVEMPWIMVADSGGRHGQPPYSPFVLVLLPFALYGVLRYRSIRWPALMMLLYAALVTALVRVLPTDVRFLLPVVVLFAVPAGAALDRLSRRFSTGAFGIAVALVLAAPGFVYGAFKVWERGPVPFSAQAKERYLSETIPQYPLLAELNRRHGRDYTIYTVYGENLRWFIDGRAFGDRLGPGRYRDLHNASSDSKSLATFFRGLGVEYVLLNRVMFALPEGKEFALVSRSGEYEVWRVVR